MSDANSTKQREGVKVRNRRNSIVVDLVDPTHALDLATKQTYTENVFLFVPNLIG